MATSTTPAAVQGSMELSCTEVEDKPQGLEMDSFEAIERLAQSFTLPPSLVVQNACVKPEEGSYNMEKKPVIPEATEKLGIAIRNPPIPTVTKWVEYHHCSSCTFVNTYALSVALPVYLLAEKCTND